MTTIEVDDEVYQALEKHVRGFKDTPNAVLRRILGLSQDSLGQSHEAKRSPTSGRTKAPKVDLEKLVQIGSIADGDRLTFRDYQQNKVNGVEAAVRGKQLEYDGNRYSMSALTLKIMRGQGYTSKAYRGPLFWYTDEGKSISDLWQNYLKSTEYA